MKVAALLLCAGRGERLGGKDDKALVTLGGRELFTWSLEAMQKTPAIEAIVMVGTESRLRPAIAAAGLTEGRIVAWVAGGRERQESVARGLAAVPPGFDFIAIHDSARALVTSELIARVVGDAAMHGAAIAALPLEDTLKRSSLDVIERTIPRAGLWRAQTPQVFRRDWIERAHAESTGNATDDAALVEAIDCPVHLTPGDPMNFKITRPRDLELAEACLGARRAEA